jgi:RNA polymerase sigma factor (sigma-70 family)
MQIVQELFTSSPIGIGLIGVAARSVMIGYWYDSSCNNYKLLLMIANPGEEQLIGLLQRSDETALKFLFQEYHPPLYYFVYRVVNDRQLTEHILSRCFTQLWSERQAFQSLADIDTWLYRFVHDALDSLQRENNSDTDQDKVQAVLVKAKLLQQVYIATHEWPAQQREVFLMIYMDGMSLFEVANALRISADTVRVLHAKALHAIRHLRQ